MLDRRLGGKGKGKSARTETGKGKASNTEKGKGKSLEQAAQSGARRDDCRSDDHDRRTSSARLTSPRDEQNETISRLGPLPSLPPTSD